MPRSHPDRRRFPRFPSDNAVLLKKIGSGGPEVPARTLEVSAGGCKLMHEASIGVGSSVELVIAAGDRQVRALGRVLYEVPLRSSRFQVGVEFLRVAPEDREALETLLSQRMASPTV